MQQTKKLDIRLRQKCIKCTRDGRPLKRVWGFPMELTYKHEKEGRITIAGCMLSDNDAQYECRHCGADWDITRD